MRKKLIITVSVLMVLAALAYTAFWNGRRHVLSKVQTVMTQDNIVQIGQLLRELSLEGQRTDLQGSDTHVADNTPESVYNNPESVSPKPGDTIPDSSEPGSTIPDSSEPGNIVPDSPESSDLEVGNSKVQDANIDAVHMIVGTQTDVDIETLSNQVPLGDQVNAARLILKVDIPYVLDMMKPGLTPEVKTELKAYMSENYKQDEIEEIYKLYNKYIHLLNMY